MPTFGDLLSKITQLKARFSLTSRASGAQARSTTMGDALKRAWQLLTWRHVTCAFRCAFARFIRR